MSRVIAVYHGVPEKRSLFSGKGKGIEDKGIAKKMQESMEWMQTTSGPMDVSEEAVRALEDWHEHGSEKDGPDHPKLKDYSTRRIVHIIKLSMIVALSRKSLEISLNDFLYAKKTLLEAEHRMPEIFKEMSSGGQKDISDEALHHMMQLYRRNHKPVSEQRLIEFLSRHIPSNQINYVIDNMIKMRMIKEIPSGFNDNSPGAHRTKIRLFEPVGLGRIEI